ncbi:arginase family protein [Portibacter marinus]|uniref:hypothetical protein n=1 Tax=Portibacter marinus TaxID=2898660 RepID=UPI001F21C6AE|nr:hypothetical protein [Portibacter marinus]
MITNILLTGDNYHLVNKIHIKLSHFNQQPGIEFQIVDSTEELQINSNEVLIYIKHTEELIQGITDQIDLEIISYVTASPKKTVLDLSTQVTCIATQRHLVDEMDENFISLGSLKNNISHCEPFIRESKLFFFDLDAIRSSDVNNESFSNPSGLYSEDATQMFRYAGMNELNKTVIINNCTESQISLISQLIWYYAEAAAIRFPDHPYFTNTVNEYVVDVDSLDMSVSFYKSKSSGRWWVKIPDIPMNKWKSCSYEDYQNACKDLISPELLNIISSVE